jgi:hypothetical protein
MTYYSDKSWTMIIKDEGAPAVADKERRASEAARLLDEPLLKEAFAQLEQGAYRALLAARATAEGDDDRRVAALRINLIHELRAQLQSVIVTGRQAARMPGIA